MRNFLLALLMIPMLSAITLTNAPVNTLPTITIISLLILVIFVACVFMQNKILGVLASIMLIMLGLWVATAGIWYQTGFNTVGATTQIIASANNSTSTYQLINTTKAYNFQKIEYPKILNISAPIDAGQLLGLITILIGVYGCFYYGGRSVSGDWI